MNIQLRPARIEDADFITRITHIASRSHLARGLWDIMIARTDDDCLRYVKGFVTKEPKTLCHWSRFIVAEADGRPAAALCGFDPRDGAFDAVEAVSERTLIEMGWSARDRQGAADRFAPLAVCFPDTADGAWIVENVGTLPELRRRGLVDSLLKEILAQGRKRGHRVAQITLFIGNTPAERAYEKVGFRFADEKRDPEFERIVGSPGFRRMLLRL